MSIVRQYDKRVGITYVYECKSFRDKDTKKPRSTRKLIGRVDPESGEIVQTDGRMKLAKERKENKEPEEPQPLLSVKSGYSKRYYFGATYLFDQIGKELGITNDLKECFPDTYKMIQSIIYFLILEDKNALYRFDNWALKHKHPYGKEIPSQRSSELFANITEDKIEYFFKLQEKRRIENEYLYYDITTISSFSETIKQIQYGHNKENNKLPQLNLSLIFGQKSQLPFYYRRLAGNMPDVKTIRNLLPELSSLGYKNTKLVLDKGFYSLENINKMLHDRTKFIISTKTSIKVIKEEIDKVYDTIHEVQNFNDTYQLYSTTVPIYWIYDKNTQKKIPKKRKVYIHIYYNLMRMAEQQNNFDKNLMKLKNEVLDGKRLKEHESQYEQYFIIKGKTPGKIRVIIKEEAVKQAKRYFGFFTLLSYEKMTSIATLELYRSKDLIEKAFCNLKDRLNFRRTSVSSESSLDGKMFIQFVALIYLSYIKKKMQEKKMFKNYTITQLLDKLDLIECFEQTGKKLRVGEVLEKQKMIYIEMGVKPPL
jgi:transposase